MSSIKEKKLAIQFSFPGTEIRHDLCRKCVKSLETVNKDIKKIISKYTVYGKLLTFISLGTYERVKFILSYPTQWIAPSLSCSIKYEKLS